MKQFYKITAIGIALLIDASPVITLAQSVTATWSLLAEQSVAITGAGSANITASPQMIGSAFTGVSYGYSTGTPAVTGWQRIGVNTGTPSVQGNYPTSFDTTNGYIQYNVSPVAGQSFTFSSMTFEALGNGSGGSRIAAFYSINNFATVDSFSATYNTGGATPYNNFPTPFTPIPLVSTGSATVYTGQQIATLTPRTGVTITAPSGSTLAIRLYYYNSSVPATSSKPLCNRNIVINGTTSTAPLPLKLVDISARLDGGTARLLWNTQSQVNVKGFDVEKSTNGRDFTFAGFITAAANLTSAAYSFSDIHTCNGANYYRLKIVDKDGSFNYSKVVVINTKLANVLSVFPNPAVGPVTITHEAAVANTQLLIQNTFGQTIKSISLSKGSTQTVVNVEALSKGTYFISYNGGTKSIMFSKL